LIESTEVLVDETHSNLSSLLTKLGAKKSDQKALDRNLSLLKSALPLSMNFIKEGLKQTVSIGGVGARLASRVLLPMLL
jgi:hypothetical protein